MNRNARCQGFSTRSLVWLLCVGILALIATKSFAEEWTPNRSIRILVPYAPGGTADLLGRIYAQSMSQKLGRQVFVENKPGGRTIIATEAIAHADPDGYTIGMIASPYSANAVFVKDLPYDSEKDLRPLGLLGRVSLLLVVNVNSPIRSVADLIARGRKQQVYYGTPAVGSVNHLAGELFKLKTGTNLVNVPYRGGGPAMNDLMAGQIDIMFNAFPSVLPFVQDGRFRALAITGDHRSPILPDVPTMAEVEVPGFELYDWFGLVLPKRTPDNVYERLQKEGVEFLQSDDTKQRMEKLGVETGPFSETGFRQFLESEIARNREIIRQTGITLN